METFAYRYNYGSSVEYEIPDHIAQALNAIVLEGPDGMEYSTEEMAEAYASRWGGLDIQTFRRVLEMGQGDEKVIAIFAIGLSGASEIQACLAPLLQSPLDAERWASACCLGLLKDERAIPALEQMLVVIGSPQEQRLRQPGFGPWFPLYQHRIAALFGTWGPPTIAATLRQAFENIWRLQKQGYCDWIEDDYQDYLCYALGQRGAFGALSGLVLCGPRLRLAMIALALGSLQARERFGNVSHEMIVNRGLKQEVAQVLEQRFALSPQECLNYIEDYSSDRLWRMEQAYAYLFADEQEPAEKQDSTSC